VLDFKIKPKHAEEPPEYDVAPFVSQPCGPAFGPRTAGP